MIPRGAYALDPQALWPTLDTQPPAERAAYVPLRAYQNWLYGHYFDASGTRVASSREVPTGPCPWPIGTWFIDTCLMPYGHFIEQLRLVDPAVLLVSEETEVSKLSDVERYAAWRREGRMPPPVSVVTTDSGRLKVSSGHRRRLAALEVGMLLPAVVGDAVLNGLRYGGDKAKPQFTNLTYELAVGQLVGEVARARAVWPVEETIMDKDETQRQDGGPAVPMDEADTEKVAVPCYRPPRTDPLQEETAGDTGVSR